MDSKSLSRALAQFVYAGKKRRKRGRLSEEEWSCDYLPSEEEIKRHCEHIKAGWSKKERRRRSAYKILATLRRVFAPEWAIVCRCGGPLPDTDDAATICEECRKDEIAISEGRYHRLGCPSHVNPGPDCQEIQYNGGSAGRLDTDYWQHQI